MKIIFFSWCSVCILFVVVSLSVADETVADETVTDEKSSAQTVDLPIADKAFSIEDCRRLIKDYKIPPLKLLSMLVDIAESRSVANTRPRSFIAPVFFNGIAPDSWIDSSTALQLLDQVQDETKCVPVMASSSSMLPDSYSTVGVEAKRMLQGFSGKFYPCMDAQLWSNEKLRRKLKEKFSAIIDSRLEKLNNEEPPSEE